MRKLLASRITHKPMPHIAMKLAALREDARGVRAAQEEGARDVMCYAVTGTSLAQCDRAWAHAFPCANAVGIVARRTEYITKLRANPRSACRSDPCLDTTFPKVLMTIGIMGSVEIAEIVAILIREFAESNGSLWIACTLDIIICGCIKYGHIDDAFATLRARLSVCRVSCGTMRAPYTFKDHGFVYCDVYGARRLFASGNIELCKLADIGNDKSSSCYIKYAARSGSREMCEYVRETYCSRSIDVGAMMEGAIKRGSSDMCDLAREWIEKYVCVAHIYSDSDTYPVSGANHYALARAMLEYAVLCGNRGMCEYMRTWVNVSRERFARELHDINVLGARAISGMDKTIAFEVMRSIAVRCGSDKAIMIEVMRRIEWLRAINYSKLLAIVVEHHWYWIADLVYKWAIDDGACMDMSCIGNGYNTDASDTAIIALRGRFARTFAI